ncbi:peptidase S41 [Oceanobacillus oncorhynchi subsp. incaldanensis]|uniref:C-terminal processing peptidase n=2 Tax=Oceanobacillus TaxID=182709 RepID=A0A0A1MQ77_9BACI|nr:S41 family peptidase [Oceanobacillus oncorhynchi]MDM8098759.1 S41 family peptidase [Oceanobacillus oncorhynchi]GIO17882.1 peptidase S41 [Oceanobacillus oncorhynchi subsp. incaldanensis]CEI81211.1 Carboxy-terminal processing protease CtpB precursor [Oceanobacillus oncorhynchi]
MKLNQTKIILILIGALLIGVLGGYGGVKLAQNSEGNAPLEITNSENETDNAEEESSAELPADLDKISQTFDLIKSNYIEDVDDNELVEGAIEGMLSTLEDPHTSYLDSEMMEQFNEQIESSFEGIGAEVSEIDGYITIMSPMKESPAEKAGLRPNDQVLSVDGESLEGLNVNEAVAKIRGEKGTDVVLEIQRSGTSDPFEVTIQRDTIPVETVYSEVESEDGKDTGVIQITNFSEHTGEEFEEQLADLEEQDIDGLVIDVRGNPGGLLDVAEEILQQFVPSDMPYLQIEDANGNAEEYVSNLDEAKDYPISVLIDEGSASASEIVAVAMKELDYDVVGETSFGKGTVQQAIPLGDDSSIKMTTLKWLSPGGEWIDGKGVEPTVEQRQDDYYYSTPIQVTDDEPLTFDHTSEAVANMQVMLSGLGYDTGRTDGYFSEETEQAVEEFQEDNDLETTGEVDEETGGLIETQVIEKIRDGEDDRQLERSLEELYQ